SAPRAQRVPGPHHILDALHFLLVAAPVLHGSLLRLLQCVKLCEGRLYLVILPVILSSPLRQRFSSASSFWMVSFRVLFFSFSFSYFFFHCSAVSSRLTEAEFLMVFALRWRTLDY
uniref:Secreted protein n=1 Tax=Denticeps clupeoides TaxID=299321 RepID=A0AAY4EYW0_9TELE